MLRPVLTSAAMIAAAFSLAACGDNKTDDVVQAAAAGQPAQEVSETRADVATTTAAVAFGLTKDQLESANLVTASGAKLGEVEQLVVDASGKPTHVVIELENDKKIAVPMDQLRSIKLFDGRETGLTTDLTGDQLMAMPAWTAG